MNYYVASSSGQVLGPYDERELVDLVTDGLLNVEDKCTPEGEEKWKALGTAVPEVWASPGAKLCPRRPQQAQSGKSCPSCGSTMSRSAFKCPACGHPNLGVRLATLGLLILIAVIAYFVWAGKKQNEELEKLHKKTRELIEDYRLH